MKGFLFATAVLLAHVVSAAPETPKERSLNNAERTRDLLNRAFEKKRHQRKSSLARSALILDRLLTADYSASDYAQEPSAKSAHNHANPSQSDKSKRRSLSVREVHSSKHQSKMDKVPLTGVYDRNGRPIQNAFVQIPDTQKQILDAVKVNAFLNPPVVANSRITQAPMPTASLQQNVQELNNLAAGDPKRKLFLDSITGALGSVASSVTGGAGDLLGSAGGAIAGAPTGALVGVGAAGAGMAARKARKEKFYFDKTRLELQMNFEDFKKEYMEYEYTELRNCNRISARINGQLGALEKNMVYRVNNRILEMIDIA